MKQTCKKFGYQKIPQREPLILKPEDWTPEEWAVLCKLSGLPPDRTERIVLYIREVEAYLGRGRKSIRPKPAQTRSTLLSKTVRYPRCMPGAALFKSRSSTLTRMSRTGGRGSKSSMLCC